MPTPDPPDANTRSFLRRVGTALPVLADPGAATRRAERSDNLPLRTLAGHLRQHTIDHLDAALTTATAAVERAGGHVHWAADAAAARAIVAELLGRSGGTVVASPMVDEVGLTAGGTGATVAVVAAAFVVAETGQLCLTGDAATTAASTLVCLAGLEAVVPGLADLAVMLKVTTAAAPAWAGGRTAIVGGNLYRAVHLIWVDNGRTRLLASEHRAALRCVGCGACTTVCPVYQAAGVTPSGLRAGPIGAVVLPVSLAADELPQASTLCGACAEVCPVRIDLPSMLIALRRHRPMLPGRLRRLAWVVRSPTRYRWFARRFTRPEGWAAPARRSFHDLWRDRPGRHA